MLFKKEDIKVLEKYESYFQTIIKSQYKRNTTPKENNEVADIWDKYAEVKASRNWGCNNCVYNLYLNVARSYFPSLEILKKSEKKAQNKPKGGKKGSKKQITKQNINNNNEDERQHEGPEKEG